MHSVSPRLWLVDATERLGATALERGGRVVRNGLAMTPVDSTTVLLAQLRDHLGYRRIAQGLHTLESIRPELDALAGCSGVLVGLVAQWVDAGFDDSERGRALKQQHRERECEKASIEAQTEAQSPPSRICRRRKDHPTSAYRI